jgi:Ca2+-binding EF-hand superfamily protein
LFTPNRVNVRLCAQAATACILQINAQEVAMYRAAIFFLALTLSPAVVAAQEPCTTDARRVVDQLYRHILERAPDAGGANWVQQRLESGQMTVRDVVAHLAKSEEHSQRFWRQEAGEDAPYSRAVGTLYRHILGRPADAAGIRTWAEQGARNGMGAIVDQLLTSREYDNQFGDWGVPGHSGGLTYCAPANQGNSQAPVVPGRGRGRGRFAGMDRNGDGIISRAEWRGNDQSFQNQDWNKDGVLSGDEVDGGAARSGRTAVDSPTPVDPREARRVERFDALDRNRNGRIESREWDGTVVAFNRLDVNNDNILSRAEMINAGDDTTATGTPAQVRAERAFNTMDVNTNGRIELREWNGTAAEFDRLDVNNDNIISRAEMINPPATGTSAQVRAERAFNAMDVNGNGRIELREWTGTAAAFDRLDVNNDNVLSRAEVDQ